MAQQYVLLGYIIDSFSLDGTLKILSKTDFAHKRYQKGNELFLSSSHSEQLISLHVDHFRSSGQFDYVKFQEINSKEEAEKYKSWEIKGIKDRSILNQNSYYYDDLIDCVIVDENDQILGKVINVEQFPAQITLRVQKDNGQYFFLPFVKAFIKNVDIEKKKIQINVIEGLL